MTAPVRDLLGPGVPTCGRPAQTCNGNELMEIHINIYKYSKYIQIKIIINVKYV